MGAPPARPPVPSLAGAAGQAADSQLLMDRFLPRYHLAVVRADVFRAPPAECYAAARDWTSFRTRWFGPCSASEGCHCGWSTP